MLVVITEWDLDSFTFRTWVSVLYTECGLVSCRVQNHHLSAMPHRARPMAGLLLFTGLNVVLVSTITPVYDFVCFHPYWERRVRLVIIISSIKLKSILCFSNHRLVLVLFHFFLVYNYLASCFPWWDIYWNIKVFAIYITFFIEVELFLPPSHKS